mgnify:CR=1 FL=1
MLRPRPRETARVVAAQHVQRRMIRVRPLRKDHLLSLLRRPQLNNLLENLQRRWVAPRRHRQHERRLSLRIPVNHQLQVANSRKLTTHFAHRSSIKWGSSAAESYSSACRICMAFERRSAGSTTRFAGAPPPPLPPLLAALLPKPIRLSSSPDVTSNDSGGQLCVGIGSSWTKLC